MSGLDVSPADKSYGLSPTTPILVVGSAPGETFDYSTLSLTVGGDPAVAGGTVVQPAYSGKLVSVESAFTLSIAPRRAFLYRVKIPLVVSVSSNVRSYSAEVTFETRDQSVPLEVGAARASFGSQKGFPDNAVLIGAVQEQLHGLLGGDTLGTFFLRVLFRIRVSQLWPAVPQILAQTGRSFDAEQALRNMRDDDVAVRGDIPRALGLIEIVWEPAVAQLGQLGASKAFSDLLLQAFRSENDLERIAAACTLVVAGNSVVRADPAALDRARALGVI